MGTGWCVLRETVDGPMRFAVWKMIPARYWNPLLLQGMYPVLADALLREVPAQHYRFRLPVGDAPVY